MIRVNRKIVFGAVFFINLRHERYGVCTNPTHCCCLIIGLFFKNMFKALYLRFNSLFTKNVKSSVFTKDLLLNKSFKIGDYTYGCPEVLYPNDNATLIVGKFCSIAQNVTIFLGGNHRIDWVSTYPFKEVFTDFPMLNNIEGHPSTNGSVIIKNDVWIGRNVIIMSGIEIDDGAVIAAGSVVTKNVGAYEVWGGNPAKFIRKRFDDNTIKSLIELAWWNWELDKIIKNAKMLCSENVNFFIESKQ